MVGGEGTGLVKEGGCWETQLQSLGQTPPLPDANTLVPRQLRYRSKSHTEIDAGKQGHTDGHSWGGGPGAHHLSLSRLHTHTHTHTHTHRAAGSHTHARTPPQPQEHTHRRTVTRSGKRGGEGRRGRDACVMGGEMTVNGREGYEWGDLPTP